MLRDGKSMRMTFPQRSKRDEALRFPKGILQGPMHLACTAQGPNVPITAIHSFTCKLPGETMLHKFPDHCTFTFPMLEHYCPQTPSDMRVKIIERMSSHPVADTKEPCPSSEVYVQSFNTGLNIITPVSGQQYTQFSVYSVSGPLGQQRFHFISQRIVPQTKSEEMPVFGTPDCALGLVHLEPEFTHDKSRYALHPNYRGIRLRGSATSAWLERCMLIVSHSILPIHIPFHYQTSKNRYKIFV